MKIRLWGKAVSDAVLPLTGRKPSVALDVCRRAKLRLTQKAIRAVSPSGALDAATLRGLAFHTTLEVLSDRRVPMRAAGAVHTAMAWQLDGEFAADDELSIISEVVHLRGLKVGAEVVVQTTITGPNGRLVEQSTYRNRRSKSIGRDVGSTPLLPVIDLRDYAAAAVRERQLAGLSKASVLAKWDVTPARARNWAKATGDRNPIHVAGVFAKGFGYSGVVLHGLALAAMALEALRDAGHDTDSGSIRFRAPVVGFMPLELRNWPTPETFAITKGARDLVHICLGQAPDRPWTPQNHGIQLPLANGRESSTQLCQTALRAAAEAIGVDLPRLRPDWRRGYSAWFAAITSDEELTGARVGVAAVKMALRHPNDLQEESVQQVKPDSVLERYSVAGGVPSEDLAAVGKLVARLKRKRQMTNPAAAAIDWVRQHPEALALQGWNVIVLGGGAELAPTRPLLRWGAQVTAVVRSQPAREELSRIARGQPGSIDFVPSELADVTVTPRELADYLAQLPGHLVLCDALYAPSIAGLRAELGAQLLTERLLALRPKTALAFLGTPTDIYSLGDRLSDFSLTEQGPNYLMSKRLVRWRAAIAQAEGHLVSAPVAPLAITESVTQRPSFARAYRGAAHVGIATLPAAQARRLMAALLVHDLMNPDFDRSEPLWTTKAVHSGAWTSRMPIRARMALALLAGR